MSRHERRRLAASHLLLPRFCKPLSLTKVVVYGRERRQERRIPMDIPVLAPNLITILFTSVRIEADCAGWP
jgi:hypothetical protein